MAGFTLTVPGNVGAPPPRLERYEYVPFDHCKCEKTELRRKTQVNGAWYVVNQCVRCGGMKGRAKCAGLNLATLPEFDEGLREAYQQLANDHYRQQREEEQRQRDSRQAEFDRWYSSYLLSPKWKQLRQRVLQRDNHLCQGCRRAAATQVHHLTYVRVGDELLFDLVSVCDGCHDRAHADR